MRKYSCSGPAVDETSAPSVWPKSFRIRCAWMLRACIERSKRGLLVQRLAGPGNEGRGNAERRAVGVFQDVGRAGNVPGRIAAGLEGGADAARRKARSVRLALDQRAAGEFGHRAAVAIGGEEAVVLLGGQSGQGVEDVGVVRRALLDGPGLDGRGHGVGDRTVELLALFDRPLQRLEYQLRQPLLHLGQAKHVGTVEFAGRRFGEIQRGRNGLVIGNGFDRLQTRRAATHVLIPPCACIRETKNKLSETILYTRPPQRRSGRRIPASDTLGRRRDISATRLPIFEAIKQAISQPTRQICDKTWKLPE